MIAPPPKYTLFPYTTLFRSRTLSHQGKVHRSGYYRENRQQQHRDIAPSQLQTCRRRKRRSEEHTSELQSRFDLVCRLLLEKKKKNQSPNSPGTPQPLIAPSG